MRIRNALPPVLGATVLTAIAPSVASACPWWGQQYGPAYGPVYYQPAPMYYAPPAYYPQAPYPGLAPRPMPQVPTVPATAATVSAADDRFDPPTLNVAPGTTVRFTNRGAHPHTVTSRDNKFDSGDIAPGATYSMTFQTPGTYRYFCKHHKGMEGTIVVGSGDSSGSKGAGY